MVGTVKVTAIYEHDAGEGVWEVELVDEPRVHTFGRTLDKAREHIRDAAALWYDLDPAELEISEELRLPAKLRRKIERARAARAKVETLQAEMLAYVTEAARDCVDAEHLSIRDAAALLELSHQRVHQLISRRS